ncbi:MAG: anti-sigma factor [Anaerolineales bacterium]
MARDEHTPFLENIPAYAIGALDAEDVIALEAHLRTCASCQTELAEYRSLNQALLTAVPPKQPSAELRKRLQSRLPSAQKPASIRPQRAWTFSFTRMAMGAAVVLLLAMNLYSILQTRSLQQEQTRLSRQIRTGQTVMSMLSYPATQRLSINDKVVGSVLVDKERDIVALIVWNMPELSQDQTYQIWLIDPNGDRTSAGIFNSETDQPYTTKIIYPKQKLTDFIGVGVTVEPAGGSDQPTGERMFRVDF